MLRLRYFCQCDYCRQIIDIDDFKAHQVLCAQNEDAESVELSDDSQELKQAA
jgi:hypothetical protein